MNIHEMNQLGFNPEKIKSIKNVNDLFNCFSDQRNAIAHFLLKGEDSHVYVSDGEFTNEYSQISTLLLHYATQEISVLRGYYIKNFNSYFRRGSILPMKENKDQFVVKDEQNI